MSMLVSILLSASLLYQLVSISLWDRGVVVKSRTKEKPNVRQRNGRVVPQDTDQPQQQAFDADLYRPHPFHNHPLSGSSPFSLSSLSAVIMFRLFDEDTLGFALEDLRNWMDYMSYAGVQHFYVYDNCVKPTECQSSAASSFLVASPRVTYTQWSIEDYQQAQVPAYNHHLQTHFPQHDFEVLLDMDEYPFMPPNNPDTSIIATATTNNNNDDDDAAVAAIRSQPNFLRNYAIAKNQDQILMRTVFFGKTPTTRAPPKDNNHNNGRVWRVERYTHRRPKAEHDSRTKPLYKPHRVEYRSPTNLHEMTLRYQRPSNEQEDFQYSSYDKQMGYDMAEDESILRLNHYWCERLLDDPNTLVQDTSIQRIVQRIKSWQQLERP